MKHLDAPPLWLAACLLAAWAQVRLWPNPFPQPLGHDIGALLLLCGFAVVVMAVLALRRHRTTLLPHGSPSRLVTTGIFGKSRNPIYLGFVLILAGASLMLGSVLGLVLVPVLVAVYRRRFIAPEEARLAATFGEEFARYAEHTRRWL